MSRIKIQDLANEIAALSNDGVSSLLLEKVRDLYEKVTLLHYATSKEIIKEEKIVERPLIQDTYEVVQDIEKSIDPIKSEDNNLSIQERIKKIMETAPTIATTENQTNPKAKSKEITTPKIEQKIETSQKIETPRETIIADEFKDAISADYAAELFEKAEKIEITKKSLNDKLSQTQLQIGLNDRIAFVKHLFDGNQSDFNRVLSQLNTFTDEAQAKYFINTVVKPDYNWQNEVEYEERLIALIERKFL